VHVAAACVTVNGWPPMLTVPVREVRAVFALTVSDTVPLPVPLAPELTMIQAAVLAAVQRHPVFAVTPTLAVPPAAAVLVLVGLMV
jgi:hypothetical protein